MPRSITIDKFIGVNNRQTQTELSSRDLVKGDNVDITDANKIRLRKGFSLLASGQFQNLWSNNIICLAILSGDLVRVSSTYTTSILRAGVGSSSMSYVDINGTIWFSNGAVIGYVKDGIAYTLPAPIGRNKAKMPAGNLLEFYKARLFVAKGPTLWISDALYPGQLDLFEGFRQIDRTILMLRAVDDGIWLGTDSKIYFLSGATPKTTVIVEKANYGVFQGASDVVIDGITIGKGPTAINSKVALFTSKEGICIGANGGRFINITEDNFVMPTTPNKAVGLFRSSNGINQYVSVFRQ